MLNNILFAAPGCTYQEGEFSGLLCWIPWNEDVPSPPPARHHCSRHQPNRDTSGVESPRATATDTQKRTRCGIPFGCVNTCALCADDDYGPSNAQMDDSKVPTYTGHVADALPCLWFHAETSPNVLLFFHANAEDLGLIYETIESLHEYFQVSVLAPEYPGYGLLKDGTTASEENCYRAALVALRYLVVDLGVRLSQIILIGRSMGSGPALFLASKFPVAGVILVNAFTSVSEVAKQYLGRKLSTLTFGNLFMNRRMIRHVASPVLFIHGMMDSIVPMMHSARLFECCVSRKLLVTPSQMEHNSNLFDSPEYLSVPTLRFFRFLCARGKPPKRMPTELFLHPHMRDTVGQAAPADSSSLSPGAKQEHENATADSNKRPLDRRNSLEGDQINCNFLQNKCHEGVRSCAVKSNPMKPMDSTLKATRRTAERAALRQVSSWGCCVRSPKRSELPNFELGLPERDVSLQISPQEFEVDGADQHSANLCSCMRAVDERNEGVCKVLATPFDGRPPPDRDAALDVCDNEIGISAVKHWDELFGESANSASRHATSSTSEPLAASDPFCGRVSRGAAQTPIEVLR